MIPAVLQKSNRRNGGKLTKGTVPSGISGKQITFDLNDLEKIGTAAYKSVGKKLVKVN